MSSLPDDARMAIMACSWVLAATVLCTATLRLTRWGDLGTSVRDALNASLVSAGLAITLLTWLGDDDVEYRFEKLLALSNHRQSNAAVAFVAMFGGLALILGLLRRHGPLRTLGTSFGLAVTCALPALFIR